MFEDNGNKCGKCQNHDFEVLKKGHARDCPYKKCDCLRCRLLDARSDILQVISGKETKLKGTKKDPNCGFCQNHGIKILRKGHVRSCDFGQVRHFRLDQCFDCEVHYIRNEVNRLQIKMRRAMKEDRTLSEEQRRTAREAITREEVEKVCEMARMAREKRGTAEANAQQVAGEPSTSCLNYNLGARRHSPSSLTHYRFSPPPNLEFPTLSPGIGVKQELQTYNSNQQQQEDDEDDEDDDVVSGPAALANHHQLETFNSRDETAADVWRPWSQEQKHLVAVIAAQQQQQQIQLQQQSHIQFQQLQNDQIGKQYITQLQDNTQERGNLRSQADSQPTCRVGSFNPFANLFNGPTPSGQLMVNSANNQRPSLVQSISNASQPMDLQCRAPPPRPPSGTMQTVPISQSNGQQLVNMGSSSVNLLMNNLRQNQQQDTQQPHQQEVALYTPPKRRRLEVGVVSATDVRAESFDGTPPPLFNEVAPVSLINFNLALGHVGNINNPFNQLNARLTQEQQVFNTLQLFRLLVTQFARQNPRAN